MVGGRYVGVVEFVGLRSLIGLGLLRDLRGLIRGVVCGVRAGRFRCVGLRVGTFLGVVLGVCFFSVVFWSLGGFSRLGCYEVIY